jgi:hypothetical protein
MDREKLTVRARRNIAKAGLELFVFSESVVGGPRTAMVGATWEGFEEGELPPAKPLLVHDQEAQLLFDELWQLGLRPTSEPSGEGIKAHLEDMRAIAFAKMEIDKP